MAAKMRKQKARTEKKPLPPSTKTQPINEVN